MTTRPPSPWGRATRALLGLSGALSLFVAALVLVAAFPASAPAWSPRRLAVALGLAASLAVKGALDGSALALTYSDRLGAPEPLDRAVERGARVVLACALVHLVLGAYAVVVATVGFLAEIAVGLLLGTGLGRSVEAVSSALLTPAQLVFGAEVAGLAVIMRAALGPTFLGLALLVPPSVYALRLWVRARRPHRS